MAHRYLALLHPTPNARAALSAALEGRSDYVTILDRPECLLVCEVGAYALPVLDRGVVIGPLYRTGRHQREHAFTPEDARLVLNTTGEFLTRAFWGGYVALLIDDGAVAVVRAPFGELPCLVFRRQDATFVASDVGMLETFGGFAPRVAPDAVARFLAAPDTRDSETCLEELSEVRGGDRLIVRQDAVETEALWSPWQHAASDRMIADPGEAAARLRGSIISSLATRWCDDERLIVMLSGGLDSSIVTAAAVAAGRSVDAVNITTPDAAGDERRYARLTTGLAHVSLEERSLDVTAVHLSTSAAAGLPRPSLRAFWSDARRQARMLAEQQGAASVISGGGGDNIFCSLQSVSALLDCWSQTGDRQEAWRVAREIGELTGTSMITVLWRAWLRSWHPRRPVTNEYDASFLSTAAIAAARAGTRHPWRERPAGVLSGKAAHVALLVGTQGLAEDADPRAAIPILYPLLSQPVVETCLRIPSWFWFDRGCNRAVARHAFSALLPPEVAWRRSKGSPDGFVVQLYDTHRGLIREMLLGGRLAELGLLDRDAISRVLDDPRPAAGTDHGRIMRLVDVETWCRSWPR